ncbi:protein phosphatase 2C domain-containing protein [Nocardiopsis lambiniae]|uniref:Protein phosphatase 2C domain-containing protein n=1 Tax=Nocardiopsis lambiniae TaxID=3075539 RepID=A0ABU2MEB4_9ACTN|nr:protein phosphatase 2C domain-containing protein [Nocardiopsis sp. DSM 44743]MDT0331024.1 protein phosphatase 2C domain-containing protein [Nocardiopsis sp. DSM 44743]
MPFLLATDPGNPDQANEDVAALTTNGAVLLDGASAPAGIDIGCEHGVAWHTRRLAGLLLAGLLGTDSLRTVLAQAITTMAELHGPACDVTDQEFPSATVILVRLTGEQLDYLVLSDSVLLMRHANGTVSTIADTRLDDLKTELGRDRSGAKRSVRTLRNTPGGFWTAGVDARAADEALTGSLPLTDVTGFAAMTDGATRGVEVFGSQTWEDCYLLAAEKGPGALIDHVRELEQGDADQGRYISGKLHDDATVVTWTHD